MEEQEQSTVGSGPAEPKRLLIDWANKQDGWVRRIVAHVISTKSALSEGEAAEFFEFYMAEKGFEGQTPPAEPMLEYKVDPSDDNAVLRLRKLREVKGVNALTPGYEIEFSPGLTILFGENGTGKTGYARILKRLAAVRQVEDIIQNINLPAGGTPQATIDFELDGQERSLAWNNEVGVVPFTRMSVFDTPAVNLHVDENLSYVYTPADLSLFIYVTVGIRSVQESVVAAVRDMTGVTNPFLRYFERATLIYTAIETLGSSTDLGALEALVSLPPNATAEKARLEREVGALRANTVEGVLAGHKDALRTLVSLGELAKAVSAFDQPAYNEQVSGLAAVRESYRRVREETFEPGELPGPADDEWQAFVAAAANYQAHIGTMAYPHTGDRCIYCRQKLDAAAVALIDKYAAFLDDALAKQVAERERTVSSLGGKLTTIRTVPYQDVIRRQKESGARDDVYDTAERLLKVVSRAQEEVSLGKPVSTSTLTSGAKALAAELVAPLEAHNAAVARFTKQLADRRTALETSAAKLAQITAMIELDRHLPEIRVYVERAKRASRLRQLSGRFPGVLKALTEVSKIASEELINQDFEQRFQEECKALRATKVKLEFVGREGKAQRRKSLASRYRLSQILSEGEQKVLALADFIAESRLGGSSAPIVFDDPVNSLDHRRLGEVAERIALLVDSRQVVVFTHDIWLATKLLGHFEGRKKECSYFAVSDDATSGAIGRVDPASGPRWDTEKELGKKIKELLADAAKSSGESQSALVESVYGVMRSWCEVAVEQVLFASVTQRFRANVMMGRLKEVRPDRLQAAIQVISEVFDRASGFIPDHSQPLESLGTRPRLEGAQGDWKTLQDAITAYRAN